jgi:predicted MPP superfamily phosphohydrolase
MSVFLISFFLVYGGVHVYAFWKARAGLDFGLKAGLPLGIFMLVMVLAPIIVRMAESRGMEGFARLFSHLGYAWLGLLFIFFSTSVAMDVYRAGAHAAGWLSGADLSSYIPSARTAFLMPIIVAVLGYAYGYYEALNIRTERVVIETPKVTKPVKIAQISDVHLGLIIRETRLRRILEKVTAEEPDMLVATGDLVDGQINSLPGLAELFQKVEPPLGKYAVMGNHEFYAGHRQSLGFIERAGFKILRGKAVSAGGLTVAGVDDPTGMRFGNPGNVSAAAVLEPLPREGFTLLLKHRPVVDGESAGLFDLQLSGHTHRGQIFPFVLAVRAFYPRVNGLHDAGGGSRLYVSRGTGTWGPPVRVFSPPEVTIIELRPERGP